MKDFLGVEIKGGDPVIVTLAHGRNSGASLARGTVLRTTPKMVEVGIQYGKNTEKHMKSPDKLVVHAW